MNKALAYHRINRLLAIVLILGVMLLLPLEVFSKDSPIPEVPVKGMVTMVDLGAAACIPCKMMAPILEKLEKRFRGRAAIVFIDLRYQREAAQRFGIRAIPTQIFFDKTGKEVFRHIGFMSEGDILRQLSSLGVK